jgi:hypothetical protein
MLTAENRPYYFIYPYTTNLTFKGGLLHHRQQQQLP